jgi:two-component system response regulator AlgR
MSSQPLHVLLADDEPLARSRLRTLLAECGSPGATVVGEAATGAEVLDWLQAHPGADACDLVLLDIQMPGLDGLALAARLRERGPQAPAVVFVTAHPEHALQAFEIEAVDYLTKPVRRERLQAALERVAGRLARTRGVDGAAPAEAPPDDVIVVNDRGRIVRVPIDEVVYLKAELKYVTLRTAQRSWLLDESLAELEPRLGQRFVRVHRNALVALKAVRGLERRAVPVEAMAGADDAAGGAVSEGWAVHLAPIDEWLAVSRRQLTAVREALART